MRCYRAILFVLLLSCLAAPSTAAHRLEPISTDFARPFHMGSGSLQINYEYERRPGTRLHLIPETELEFGFAPRMQLSLEMPLIWNKPANEPAAVGAGHLEIGFRYLLSGGEGKSFAISLNPFVTTPTGNRTLAGDASEAGMALHLDKEFGKRVFFRGNYGWSSTIEGSEAPERIFFYRSALVLPATHRWNPGLEFLGETDTATGRTEFFLQPEMIYYVNRHWELKVGLPIRMAGAGAQVGLKAQIAWIFGRGSD